MSVGACLCSPSPARQRENPVTRQLRAGTCLHCSSVPRLDRRLSLACYHAQFSSHLPTAKASQSTISLCFFSVHFLPPKPSLEASCPRAACLAFISRCYAIEIDIGFAPAEIVRMPCRDPSFLRFHESTLLPKPNCSHTGRPPALLPA